MNNAESNKFISDHQQKLKEDQEKIPNAKWANWALLQAWFKRQSQGTPLPDSGRPALAELIVDRFAEIVSDHDEYGKPGPRCFVVICTGGYWGRGKTLEEATKNSKAPKVEKAFIYLVLNGDVANVSVDVYGTPSCSSGAMFVNIGKSTVGGILNANK